YNIVTYTHSLHDALPILLDEDRAIDRLDRRIDRRGADRRVEGRQVDVEGDRQRVGFRGLHRHPAGENTRQEGSGTQTQRLAASKDRKSTRLNSSHVKNSY